MATHGVLEGLRRHQHARLVGLASGRGTRARELRLSGDSRRTVTFSGMRITALLAVAICAATPTARAQAPATLIVNAKVIDGTGAPARSAEVRIVDGRINSIGHWTRNPADRVVDAHGLTLAPGFIDTHSHHDGGIFDRRDALAAVSQGITT